MCKTLTRADIIREISEKSKIGHLQSKYYVEVILRIMLAAIKEEQHLLISGFGTFTSYKKENRPGRNPRTGQPITLQGQHVVVFRVSKGFRQELNQSS
ncbi:MAG: HU family DNA-binding protein [Desulfovibrio sp.]|nr:HU family DNA-binding protein [Desulfovibrio sp.]